MIAIVPKPLAPSSVIVGTGDDEGVTSDVSVEVRFEAGQRFTIRTLLRTGERMGPAGSVHGTLTDTVSFAALTVRALLLQNIPTGLSREEVHDQTHRAFADAERIAQDHRGWFFSPMLLDGVTYALRHRILENGFVAHADIGDSAVSAWGIGDLPESLRQTQRVDSDTLEKPSEAAHAFE